MYRKYDVFEKFPDGSSLWRGYVSGLQNTRLQLQELMRHSLNQFYAIDIAAGKVIRLNRECDPLGFPIPRKGERPGSQRVA
jgi:hypothetical protein